MGSSDHGRHGHDERSRRHSSRHGDELDDREYKRSRRDDYDSGRDRKYERTSSRDRDRGHHSSRHEDSRDRHGERARARDRDRYDEDQHRSRHHHRSSSKRESSSERRERKRAEKAARKAQQEADAEQRAKTAEMLMYSAEDNPFNDANLGSKFKWGKKEEKEKKMGLTPAEARARDERRRQEAVEEIARLNAKRAEREKEQALREEEEARLARLQESAAMSEWVAKEDDFHLEQSKKRAIIRVRENRAKPIDLLALNLKWADPEGKRLGREKNAIEAEEDEGDEEAGLDIDLEEPYNIFDNLTLSEVEELENDIKMYLSLEKNEQNLEFWRSMIIVCEDKLDEMRGVEGHHSRIDPSVRVEMNEMLAPKTHDQLVQLQNQVQAKLASGEPVDVEYWEGLLKSIVVWRAKSKLRALHSVVLSNRIEFLRKKQREEALRQQYELVDQLQDDLPETEEEQAARTDAQQALEEEARFETAYDPEEMEPERFPSISSMPYEDRNLPVVDAAEELKELMAARKRVIDSIFVPKARVAPPKPAEGETDMDTAMYQAEASKALDVEEEVFNQAEELARQSYSWEDKYRPRKPRYFNRVHTGYEWNKYNQTHYDTDNPPPKVVQGYKFNIFYPDLIDKTKAPTYRIQKIPDDPDTVLLVFSAGPPYEDIAFRVVNKQWEMGHKRGFRNSFDRGVLQLWFNFVRMRYRK